MAKIFGNDNQRSAVHDGQTAHVCRNSWKLMVGMIFAALTRGKHWAGLWIGPRLPSAGGTSAPFYRPPSSGRRNPCLLSSGERRGAYRFDSCTARRPFWKSATLNRHSSEYRAPVNSPACRDCGNRGVGALTRRWNSSTVKYPGRRASTLANGSNRRHARSSWTLPVLNARLRDAFKMSPFG